MYTLIFFAKHFIGCGRPVEVYLELGLGIAHGSQCGDDGNRPAFQMEAGPGVNVTEGKFDQVAGKVGRRGRAQMVLQHLATAGTVASPALRRWANVC